MKKKNELKTNIPPDEGQLTPAELNRLRIDSELGLLRTEDQPEQKTETIEEEPLLPTAIKEEEPVKKAEKESEEHAEEAMIAPVEKLPEMKKTLPLIKEGAENAG